MMAVYQKHGIKIFKSMGGDAVRQTGLRWKQIYKWIFEMHKQLTNQRKFETGQSAKIFNIKKYIKK